MTATFPPLTRAHVLLFQFSSWYPVFRAHSIKSTVIRPLPPDFVNYLHSDGILVPEGSEDSVATSTLSDEEDDDAEKDDSDSEEEQANKFSFPELDAKIRDIIKTYGAVFPKLNFSSPKDAAWLFPASSPLKCTSPADVYMLLKSSDFVTHDLDVHNIFAGCQSDLPNTDEEDARQESDYELELVLRKWYAVDRSREMRCFVRNNFLTAISQRDTNYYEFLNDTKTQQEVVNAVQQFWEEKVKLKWTGPPDYTFDILLTRDLARMHILDFNPYAPRTDSLLFTYEDLHLPLSAPSTGARPQLRVIDNRAHPSATSNAPEHQHNMVPFEALSLSSGRDVVDFAKVWDEKVSESAKDSDDE